VDLCPYNFSKKKIIELITPFLAYIYFALEINQESKRYMSVIDAAFLTYPGLV